MKKEKIERKKKKPITVMQYFMQLSQEAWNRIMKEWR
jgi:hypothetical protein